MLNVLYNIYFARIQIVASVHSCLTPALPNDHEILVVDFQVWKSDSLARIKFKLPSGAVGQAEFKRRNIDGEVGHRSWILQICWACALPVVSHVVESPRYSLVDQPLLRSVVCTACGDSRLNRRKWMLALETTNDRNPTNWSYEPRDFLPSFLHPTFSHSAEFMYSHCDIFSEGDQLSTPASVIPRFNMKRSFR